MPYVKEHRIYISCRKEKNQAKQSQINEFKLWIVTNQLNVTVASILETTLGDFLSDDARFDFALNLLHQVKKKFLPNIITITH